MSVRSSVFPSPTPRGAAVVFGGASGLGEAAARRLAADYELVVGADRDEPRAKLTAGEIGGVAVACDVTDEASVQDAIDVAAETDGGLRIAVSCAGIAPPAKLV